MGVNQGNVGVNRHTQLGRNIFISDDEKQKFYANSKDQLSPGKPSNFREITDKPIAQLSERPYSRVYAIPEHLVNSVIPSVTPLVWSSVHQTTDSLKFSLFTHHCGIVTTKPDFRLWELWIYEPTKSSI